METESTMKRVAPENNRGYVRAAVNAEVQFTVMDAQDYEGTKGDDLHHRLIGQPMEPLADQDNESGLADRAMYSSLIRYLMHIEDKLDRILTIVAKDEEHQDEALFVGRSIDISGTGLRILSDRAVKPGQVLSIDPRIFRFPEVPLGVYGRVVRVTPADGQRYEVAVEFLDLDEHCKDSIISYVFQMQRKALRDRKDVGTTNGNA